MKELEKLIMAVYTKKIINCKVFYPRYSLDRRPGGPQNLSGRGGEEKHIAPAGNPTLAVQPVAHRDATHTGVIRMECTPLHIYFSPEFRLQLLHLCGPALNNFILLQFGLTCPIYFRFLGAVLKANNSGHSPLPVTASERTQKKTTPHCCIRAAACQQKLRHILNIPTNILTLLET
jgi:hypothetical protein